MLLALLDIGPLRQTVMSIIVSKQLSVPTESRHALSFRSGCSTPPCQRLASCDVSSVCTRISFRRLSCAVRLHGIDAKRASCSWVRPDPSGQPSHGPKPHRMVSFASQSSNTRSEVMIFVASDSRSPRPLAPDTAWRPTPLSTLLTLRSPSTHRNPHDFTGQWLCVCLNSLA